MNPETYNYINDRLDPQIKYFCGSSAKAKKRHRLIVIMGIIITGIVPILTFFIENPDGNKTNTVIKIIIASVSTLSSVLLSINNFLKNGDLWAQYRLASEFLKSEKVKYYMSTGKYNVENEAEKLKILVDSCETFLSSETQSWKKMNTKSHKNDDD
jgi:hypothetical protein